MEVTLIYKGVGRLFASKPFQGRTNATDGSRISEEWVD